MKNRNRKILSMVEMAMLVALVVVLQLFGGMIKIPFLPFSFSLVLIPIVIGSIILSYKHGAALGFIFGFVVVIQCATGADAGGFILWGINPLLTALICLVKGTAAGILPGVIYRSIVGKCVNKKTALVGAALASVSAPIFNTGIFLIGLSTCFYSTLVEWAAGTDVLAYVITGLVGINFIVEFLLNLILAPAICTVIDVISGKINK